MSKTNADQHLHKQKWKVMLTTNELQIYMGKTIFDLWCGPLKKGHLTLRLKADMQTLGILRFY